MSYQSLSYPLDTDDEQPYGRHPSQRTETSRLALRRRDTPACITAAAGVLAGVLLVYFTELKLEFQVGLIGPWLSDLG